jgi:hypothetical protein
MSKRPINILAAVTNFFKGEDLAWLLVFVFSLPAFEFNLGPTIDASIRLVQNLNFDGNQQALFAAHLPQGPLAFLQYPLPIGINLSLALIYYGFIKLGILIFLKRQDLSTVQALLLYAAVYLLVAPRLLPLCLLIFILFDQREKGVFSFTNLASLSLVLVLLYTRLSLGILGGALWFVTHLFLVDQKSFSFKRLLAIVSTGFVLLMIFLLPYCFFSPLSIVIARFWAILGLNAAYGLEHFSLVFFATVAILLIFAFMLFGTITLGPFKAVKLKSHQKAQAFLLLLYALLYFRSRPDAGTYYVLINLALIFFIAIQAVHSIQVWKSMFIWLAAAMLLGEVFLAQGSFKTTELRVGAFFSQALKPTGYREKFRKDNFKERGLIPPSASYTLVTDNFGAGLLENNHLVSSPAYIPVLAENPLLDSLNAAFYTSAVAPDYILAQERLEESLSALPRSKEIIGLAYKLDRKEDGLWIYQKRRKN